MTTHAGIEVGRTSAERPDAPYSFVAGLYTATLLIPAVVLLLSRVLDGTAVLYAGSLAATTCLTTLAGWTVSRMPGLAVELGRRDAVWTLAVLPFGWLGGLFGATVFGVDPAALVILLAILGSGGGVLLGIVLVAMSRTRHADATLEGATQSAEWEARWPRRWRRTAVVLAVGAVTLGLADLLVGVWSGGETGWGSYYLFYFWVPLIALTTPRTFRVTSAGLVVEYPLQRQVRPWSAYAGYEVTEEALVIRSTSWWRPAHRCDRTDVEDVDSVVSALSACLTGQTYAD